MATVVTLCLPAATSATGGSAQPRDFHVYAAGEPALTVQPPRAANGWTVDVAGSGFPSGALVRLFWDCDEAGCDGERAIAEGRTGSDGALSPLEIQVPDDARHGPHEIVAISGTVRASVQLIVRPWVTVEPRRGQPGWNAELRGTGFEPGETVQITWSCSALPCPGGPIGHTVTDDLGRFEAIITVPAGTSPGEHSVAVAGDQSNGLATTAFEVVLRNQGRDPLGVFIDIVRQVVLVAAGVAALGIAVATARALVHLRRRR